MRTARTRWMLAFAVVALTGCTAAQLRELGQRGRGGDREPAGQPLGAADVAAYEGVWLGQGRVWVDGTGHAAPIVASLSPSSSALEIGPVFRGGVLRARLKPDSKVQGKDWFEVEEFTSGGSVVQGEVEEVWTPERVGLAREPDGRLTLEILPPEGEPQGRMGRSTFYLHLPERPPAGNSRHYGSFGPYLYTDWRHRQRDVSFAGARPTLQRVGEDITLLRDKGWECLAQTRRYVSADRPTTVEFRSSTFSPPLYLLFSSNPNARLVLEAGTAGYIHLQHNGVSYPVVQQEAGGRTVFDFHVLPAPGTLEESASTEVLIFQFGATLGDYGSGCDVTPFGIENRRTSGEYIKALGTVLLAVGLEGVRRESIESDSRVFALLAEMGRDASIESALRQLVPDASDSEIGYFTRWAGLVLSWDLSGMSLARETSKEYITQMIQRDAPQFAGSELFIDFLVDLHVDRMLGG